MKHGDDVGGEGGSLLLFPVNEDSECEKTMRSALLTLAGMVDGAVMVAQEGDTVTVQYLADDADDDEMEESLVGILTGALHSCASVNKIKVTYNDGSEEEWKSELAEEELTPRTAMILKFPVRGGSS